MYLLNKPECLLFLVNIHTFLAGRILFLRLEAGVAVVVLVLLLLLRLLLFLVSDCRFGRLLIVVMLPSCKFLVACLLARCILV